MPSPTLVEPNPSPIAPPRAGSRAPSHPVTMGLISAVLLWSTFPPAEWWWLAWVALVPLFLLVRSERSRPSIYLGAWVGGFAFWLLAIQWVRFTDDSAWLGWVVMALALSFWWPAFLVLARLAVRRLRLPMMVAAPVVWVGLEYVRAYVLTGFPWYYLAHSHYRVANLIQLADVTGALGISFLIAMANAWWVDLATLPLLRPTGAGPRLTRPQVTRLAILGSLLAATLGYGTFRVTSARFREGPRLALIQSSLLQSRKTAAKASEILAVYARLIERAAGDPRRPDLIVWPETSYPFRFVAIDPKIDPATFDRQAREVAPDSKPSDWLEGRRKVTAHLHEMTDRLRVPMLVGALTYDFQRDGFSKYNSAILIEPGVATIQSYHKLHLVPFGEYVPLVDALPWLTALTPYRGTQVPSLNFGREAAWFTLGRFGFAAAICFEDTVPQVVRRFFDERKAGHPPDLLINQSNDGWFHGSAEHDMHLAVSIFRAIENRVPLARAVNTGVSAFIDGNGRILESLPKLREGVLARTIPLDDRTSLYSSWGDWLGLSCLAVTTGLIPLAWTRSVLRRRHA